MSTFSDIWRSSRWTLASGLVKLLVQLAVYILIGRMIDPSILGEYFLSATFIFLPIAVVEYSFNNSIIYHEGVSTHDRRAVYTLNLIAYALIFAVGLLLCYLLGNYYEYSEMSTHFIRLSPLLLFYAYSSVQMTQLRKELKFQNFAIIEIIGSLILGATTIALLQYGQNVMAIIYGLLARHITVFLILLLKDKAKGILPMWDRNYLKKHFNYGRYIVGEKSFGQILGYSDSFIINHFFGAHLLGVYEVLKRIVFRPILVAYESIEQVYFPVLNMDEDKEDLSEKYHAFIKLSMLSVFSFLLVILSEYWLPILGEQYGENSFLLLFIIASITSLIILGPVDILSYSLNENKRFMIITWIYGVIQLVAMISAGFVSIYWVLAVSCGFNILFYLFVRSHVVTLGKRISYKLWLRPVLVWLIVIATISIGMAMNLDALPFVLLFLVISALAYYLLIFTFHIGS